MEVFYPPTRGAQFIVVVIGAFAVAMGFFDVAIVVGSLLNGQWLGMAFGFVGLLICYGYAATAWRGFRVVQKVRRRRLRRGRVG